MIDPLSSRRYGFPLISAHRGGAAYAPENTMAAFQSGWERGADLLELDVQLSRDGQAVVIHDPTVDRTTDGTGFVAEKTLEELYSLDAGSWFGEGYRGARIPLLEEVVAWARGRVGLNIELKVGPHPFFYPDLPGRVTAILRDHSMVQETLITSFDHTLVRAVKTLEPALVCAINFTARVVDPVFLAQVSRADILNMHAHLISPELVELAHDHGLGVQCFCDEPEMARRLAAMGVDFLDCDRPEVIKAAVRSAAD